MNGSLAGSVVRLGQGFRRQKLGPVQARPEFMVITSDGPTLAPVRLLK